jgi:hypothetical protein
MPYAIVQNGHAIFGVGDTPSAAYRDAKEWTDDLPAFEELSRTPLMDGKMFWAKITPALARQVNHGSGDIAWGELPDGTLCTVAEENA